MLIYPFQAAKRRLIGQSDLPLLWQHPPTSSTEKTATISTADPLSATICDAWRQKAIKSEFTADDALSRRIFHDEPPEESLGFTGLSTFSRAKFLALQEENQLLQQALLLSSGLRQRFEELYDASPIGLLSLDADDHIIEANLTFAQLLDTQRPRLIGQHLGKMIADEDHAAFIQHLTHVREQTSCSPACERCTVHLTSAGSPNIEVRLESCLIQTLSPALNFVVTNTTKTSNTLSAESPIIRINVYPITKEDNSDQQCHADLALINQQLQKEISERKLAEEKTRQHQDDLAHVARLNTVGEMASGLAHEINQPLAAIASYTQSCLRLLRGDKQKQAQVPNILEQVNTQAQRAASIVKHLRNFVTKGQSHREIVELSNVVRLAVSMVRNEIVSHQIALTIDTQPALPTIKADSIQIEQVILNLLRNAIEAMNDVEEDSRKLLIIIDRFSPTHVSIAISDTGSGIADDHSHKLSTPFFSTKETGMGLGLAISRTIVEDHGGQLTHSVNTDGGATFTFTLGIDGKQASTQQ